MFRLRRSSQKTPPQEFATLMDPVEEVPNWNNLEKSAQLFHDATLDWSNPSAIIEVLEEFADEEEEEDCPHNTPKRA